MPELRYIKKLSKLVCLATSKLENKHSGKIISLSLYTELPGPSQLTDTSAKRIATHFPHVPPLVILMKSQYKKGFSFSFCWRGISPWLRFYGAVLRLLRFLAKEIQHQHTSPPIKSLSWASTLSEGTSFDVMELYRDWQKWNSPGRCEEPEAAPASIQILPSLSMDPDEAGSQQGLATVILWAHPMLLTERRPATPAAIPSPEDGSHPCLLLPCPCDVRRQGMRQWALSAWQSCMRAAEHIRETQQRKGAGVSCISSERRMDLPTQRVQSGPWKQHVVEMVHGRHQQWDRHWYLSHIVHKVFRFLL